MTNTRYIDTHEVAVINQCKGWYYVTTYIFTTPEEIRVVYRYISFHSDLSSWACGTILFRDPNWILTKVYPKISLSILWNISFHLYVSTFYSDTRWNKVWILAKNYLYFFFYPAGRTDGEVLWSKVWILMVNDTADLFCCAWLYIGKHVD